MVYTREDYLNRVCTHREYYAQFVNDRIRKLVQRSIEVTQSKDEYFNDIPLACWDSLSAQTLKCLDSALWRELECPAYKGKMTFAWSPNSNICILKEAAQQLRDIANGDVK